MKRLPHIFFTILPMRQLIARRYNNAAFVRNTRPNWRLKSAVVFKHALAADRVSLFLWMLCMYTTSYSTQNIASAVAHNVYATQDLRKGRIPANPVPIISNSEFQSEAVFATYTVFSVKLEALGLNGAGIYSCQGTRVP